MSDERLSQPDGLLPIPFEDIRLLVELGWPLKHQERLAKDRIVAWLSAWENAEEAGCRPAVMLPPRVRDSFSIDYEDEL